MPTDPIRVLLIEDSQSATVQVCSMLQSAPGVNFHICVEKRLADGLARLEKGDIDIVLLDLFLPDSEGLRTLDRVVTSPIPVPVVVLTGTAEEVMAAEAQRRGAQDYLVKGDFDNALLVRSMQYARERFQFVDRLRRQAAELRAVTMQLSASIWTTDEALRISSVLGVSFFGESPTNEGIVGKTIIEHFQGDDPNYPLVAAHRSALQGRSISSDVPWGERIFHTHVEPLRDPMGRIIGTLGVALDVTDSTRLRSEMVLARRIQEMFWRSALIQVPSWDVAGASYPAESTSGDYFDFIRTGDGKVIIAMGDVSGHGVGPALLGVSLRGHIRAWSQVDHDIVNLLSRANLMVCADAPEDRFITCMLALFDPQTGTFTYANAGHPAGYVLDRQGKVRCRLSNTCTAPLGIDESAQFAAGGEVTLAQGEMLLWISDGALDAFDLAENRFGEDRLLQSVRLFRNDSARQIIYNLYHTIRAYAHEKQDDDISAVVVKAAEPPR